MSDTDGKPEPPATPWPVQDRKKADIEWPSELDEATWADRKREEADEE